MNYYNKIIEVLGGKKRLFFLSQEFEHKYNIEFIKVFPNYYSKIITLKIPFKENLIANIYKEEGSNNISL